MVTENIALELTCPREKDLIKIAQDRFKVHIKNCKTWFELFEEEVTSDIYSVHELIRRARDLIEMGVDINVKAAINVGSYSNSFPAHRTALHIAALYYEPKRTPIMSQLLRWGADPNAQTIDGRTPAHWLSWDWECEESYKLLKEYGADLYAKDRYGCLPEHNAPSRRAKEIVWRIRNGKE